MVEVTRISADDWADVKEVCLAVMGTRPGVPNAYEREMALDEQEWRRRLADGAWFLALVDGQPVGVAAGMRASESECELVAMWVSPEQQGKGVASRLVEAVDTWANESGTDVLRMAVRSAHDL